MSKLFFRTSLIVNFPKVFIFYMYELILALRKWIKLKSLKHEPKNGTIKVSCFHYRTLFSKANWHNFFKFDDSLAFAGKFNVGFIIFGTNQKYNFEVLYDPFILPLYHFRTKNSYMVRPRGEGEWTSRGEGGYLYFFGVGGRVFSPKRP